MGDDREESKRGVDNDEYEKELSECVQTQNIPGQKGFLWFVSSSGAINFLRKENPAES